MKNQLIKLLNHYGLSATKLADAIGVQPSSISHILSGRNKPSYDFIVALINKFPEINPKWLLTGKENMFIEVVNSEKIKKNHISELTLFNEVTSKESEKNSTEAKTAKLKEENENEKENNIDNVYKSEFVKNVTNVNSIEYVILLFDNGTFKQFKNNEE
jgi:plasmid maintenance system antidote protein VapI